MEVKFYDSVDDGLLRFCRDPFSIQWEVGFLQA